MSQAPTRWVGQSVDNWSPKLICAVAVHHILKEKRPYNLWVSWDYKKGLGGGWWSPNNSRWSSRPISLKRPQMSYCNLLQLLRVRTNFTSISPHWPAAHVLSCVQQTALWSWRDPPTEPAWLLSFNETNSQTRSRLLLILTVEETDAFENGS